MNLIEKGDILEYGIVKLDYNVLKPDKWTVCLTECIKTIFYDINEVVNEYTSYTDFYKNNGLVSKFISSLKLIKSSDEFMLDITNRRLYIKNIDFSKEQIKKEVFYALKLGVSYENITSAIVYYLKTCFEDNEIPDTYSVGLLPETDFKELSSGQLGNPLDIISDVYGEKFYPITSERKTIIKDNLIEFYVKSLDCTAIAPISILNEIPEYKLIEAEIKKGVLSYNNRPLHFYCGKAGIYKSNACNLVECI